jgi:hypothetical protein
MSRAKIVVAYVRVVAHAVVTDVIPPHETSG